MAKPRNYTEEVLDFIRKDYIGVSNPEMARRLEQEFGRKFEKKAVGKYRNLIGCPSGRKGAEGCIPHNKGRKGYVQPGCEKGWFKKGEPSHNCQPIGTEVINGQGYCEVKVSESKWIYKQRLVWEQVHGPVPKGYSIIFADGNKENFDIDNLICVSNREKLAMNQQKLRFDNAEMTKAGHNLAKLIIATQERSGKNA